MKNLILKLILPALLLFFFLSSGETPGASGKNENFILKITLEKRETSDDSHSDRYSVNIINNNVDYHWKHSGFPDDMEKNEKYTLSSKVLNNLILYIKEKKLNRSLKENKPGAEIGLSVSMQLEITLEGKTTRSSISGAYNDWTMRKKKKTSNIKNLDYFQSADSIVSGIRNRMEYF